MPQQQPVGLATASTPVAISDPLKALVDELRRETLGITEEKLEVTQLLKPGKGEQIEVILARSDKNEKPVVKTDLPKSNPDALKKDAMSTKILTTINEVLGEDLVKLLPAAQPEAKRNITKHLAHKFSESGKRTMVIGHRGGGFGPDNSLMSF